MSSATLARDQLRPQRPGGLLRGAALALLAHAALLLALTAVVQWRTHAPEAVQAELWAAVPQLAAPPLPPAEPPAPAPAPTPAPTPAPPPRPAATPTPAPPDPQIALEQERKRRAQQERLQQEAQEKAQEKAALARVEHARAQKEKLDKERVAKEQAAKAQAAKEQAAKERQQAEDKRLADLRKTQLERMMGQVGGSGSTAGAGAAQSSGPSAGYAGRLITAIKPNVLFVNSVAGNPAAEVEVRAGPSGSILSRRLLRSSGNPNWDEAVLRAIDRTATLPRDVDGRVPPVIVMAFRPAELQP